MIIRLYIEPKHGSDLQKGLKKATARASEGQTEFVVVGLRIRRDIFGFYVAQTADEVKALPARGFHIKDARLRQATIVSDVTGYDIKDGFYQGHHHEHARVTSTYVYPHSGEPQKRRELWVAAKEAKWAMKLHDDILSGKIHPKSPYGN